MSSKLHGKDQPHSIVATVLDNLAGALKARGDRKSLKEAIRLYKQSFEMDWKLHGKDQPLRRGHSAQ